jgi:DNA-binding transcriptional ArsR family regulator
MVSGVREGQRILGDAQPGGATTRQIRRAASLSSHLTVGQVAPILQSMLNQAAQAERVFQALAAPSRRFIVDRLSTGPASVSELARPLEITLAAVVQHLQVLEASGIVRSEKVGRVRTCRIEPGALQAAEQWIAERRAMLESQLDRLGAHLAENLDASDRDESTRQED